MMLQQQVFAHAVLLAGELEEQETDLLQALCAAAAASLSARLKKGITPEDCKADFVASASLFALAELNSVKDGDALEQITAGDLTLRKVNSGDTASNVLRNQASLMIAPYLKDRFCFRGV